MTRKLPTRLIFSFYLYSGWKESKINQVHFEMLRKYSDRFDEVIICFNIDDNATIQDKIEAKDIFIDIFGDKHLIFKEYANTELRETNVFFSEVATKLKDLSGYTFFAHNKGITEENKGNDIIKWVCGLYYFSLENIDDVFFSFDNRKLCYGSFPQFSPWDETKWFYGGTFFWINGNGLYNFMKMNKIELPLLSDRWYDEFFLGRIIDTYGFMWASFGYFMPEMTIQETLYSTTDEKVQRTYPYQVNDFNSFCNPYLI